MKVTWSAGAWADYQYWLDNDITVLRRINELVKDARRRPFAGIGKPEPLKAALSGWWSRRITDEHRLVYRVSGKGDEQALKIIQCRFHYG